VATCPEDTVQFGVGNNNRACKPTPVDCKPASGDCVCPAHLGEGCRRCSYGAAGVNTCVRCKAGPYYLVPELGCLESLTCKGSRFTAMPQRRCGCKTAIDVTSDHCSVCTFTGGQFGKGAAKKCTKCTHAKYLAPDGRCIQPTECPVGTVPAGVGNNGRECREPFTCKGGVTTSGPGTDSPCSCEKYCEKCSWGEAGHRCRLCGRKQYELDGACAGSCPAGFSHVGVGR